jgi:uncharacterized damage-inducible protein DinB
MLETLKDLYAHMEWADGRMWRTVMGATEYAEADAVLDTVAHLHMVQHAFLDTWMERTVGERDPRKRYPEAGALKQWACRFYPEATAFVEGLEAGRLAQEFRLPWAHLFAEVVGREPKATTMRDTLLQLVLHTTHHRAQVSREIRRLGGEPPIVDYIGWVWAGRPDPSWP